MAIRAEHRSIRRVADLVLVGVVALALPFAGFAAANPSDDVPVCAPAGGTVVLEGAVTPDDARSYAVLPFEVAEGTTRVEVGYAWADEGLGGSPPPPSTPFTQTVFDLGLWDEHGYREAAGFRGWSGSRQGKLHEGQDPIWVQADSADRSYRAAPVEPGIWHVELGIAAVGPTGATWRVEIDCLPVDVGEPPTPDPVDEGHVARGEAGWYHGDFHVHAFHSSPDGPDWHELVDFVRDAELDFVTVTEYVVPWHWEEMGAAQRANPDVLLWPGREIITYFGHANALGETPGVVEYRHGFEDITMTDIQRDTVEAGALFQVAHPTTFSGPLFRNFCRGCEYELEDETDWALVDTIEILTGPVLVDLSDAGGPATPVDGENPFMQEAIDLWEEQLLAGHRITAVSGSDDKGGPDIGMNATAVYAWELSRAGLIDGLRSGHAYVRTRGVADSPALELVATTDDGQEGIMGDTLRAEEAEITVTVTGGQGQLLSVFADGLLRGAVPITDDEFAHTFTATRSPTSGPLGTFWRVETRDELSRTAITNPVFLAEPADEPDSAPDGGEDDDDPPPQPVAEAGALPATGGAAWPALGLLLGAALFARAGRSSGDTTALRR